jgi:hypothetical protein
MTTYSELVAARHGATKYSYETKIVGLSAISLKGILKSVQADESERQVLVTKTAEIDCGEILYEAAKLGAEVEINLKFKNPINIEGGE